MVPEFSEYWQQRRIGRRASLRGAALAAGGVASLSLLGCSTNKNNSGNNTAAPANQTRNAGAATAQAPATRAAAGVVSPTPAAVDFTKGKSGGTLRVQTNTFPKNFRFIEMPTGARVTGFCYSGLLAYKAGKAGVDPNSIDLETDVAAAMPEQPDELTYVFKLRPDVKFHNGRQMVADDVKYSIERFAYAPASVVKDSYTWIDSITATDAQTVVVKTKAPFADTLVTMAAYQHPFILAKEHEEGPDADKTMVGTGPFMYVSDQAPVSITVKKNPDYYLKPLPYFDGLEFDVITDTGKQVADFISKQIQFAWYVTSDNRNQIKQSRPDAQNLAFEKEGQCVYMRADQAPFNDARVRQALSMTIDRKALRDSVNLGEGQDDQALSIANKAWGFRKPSELGAAAKYWTLDPQSAKQLLAAAGITKPIEKTMTIASDPANQRIMDQGTLIQSKWKELGIANVNIIPVTTTQFQSTVVSGAFDDLAVFNNTQVAILGIYQRTRWWSPPEGVKPPTANLGHVNDPDLNTLMDKQLTQVKFADRRATFSQIEDLLGTQQYRFILSTAFQNWFLDPSLKDASVFAYANNSTAWFVKYWWFG